MAEAGTEVEQLRGALIQVEIGGQVYDAVREPRCHTCMHPARIDIEKRILSGHSYRDIAQQYSGTEYQVGGETRTFPDLSWMSIFQHVKNNHMPLEAAVARRILDDRTKALSEHYEEETERIVDGFGFAQQVLQRTQQRLATGQLQPSIQDGLAAAKLIKDFEAETGGDVDSAIWAEAFVRYFEITRELMPDDMWEALGARLTTDPVLRAIKRRVDAAAEEEPIDAEFTEGAPE